METVFSFFCLLTILHVLAMRIMLLLLILMTQSMNAQEKITIIYVGDPMCSWCYGFSPELSTFLEQWKDQVDVQLIMGGLRPYNTESMTNLRDFLREHWEEVHKASGQNFKFDILDDASITYDTEPSCRAICTFKTFQPDKSFEYFKDVQAAFYAENKHPLRSNTFAELAATYGIDQTKFTERFESDEMKLAVKQDFQQAQALHARSFPTVIAKKGDQYYLMAQGYIGSEVLSARLQQLIGS